MRIMQVPKFKKNDKILVLKTKYSPFCNKVSMFFKNKKKIDNNKLNKTK